MRFFISILIATIFSISAFSQQQPAAVKKAFIDSTGRYYQQATLPVYLYVSSSNSEKPILLKPTSKKEVLLEGNGVHSFKHKNDLTNEYDEFQIYADGIAPKTEAVFEKAVVFKNAQSTFYGTGLQVSLSSKDEMSGVEKIYHSINGQDFNVYKAPNFADEGTYTYKYYAIDKTGNTENVNVKSFTVDLTPPETFHNIVGISSENVISTNSTIYLDFKDKLSGVARTFYKFNKEDYILNSGGKIPFQQLPDGNHTIFYYSEDYLNNKEEEKSFSFYLDKTAPIMSADVLGDKFIVGKRVYFSGLTKLKLTAIDNKSGIKDVMYSINDGPEVQYAEPFYLPNRSGIHNVKFRAVDNNNNLTKDDFAHSVGVIYVDLTGPSISHFFNGPSFNKADTIFISPLTKVTIAGNDPESGLKMLAYSFSKNSDELPYTNIPLDSLQIGFHTLSYFGYDNVNNRNSKQTSFVVDGVGPKITTQFANSPGGENKYPSYTSVYLSATDLEVGVDQIKYSINGAKELPFTTPLKGFEKNKAYTIKITATDLLGNSSIEELIFETDKY